MVSGEYRDRHHIMAVRVVQATDGACSTGLLSLLTSGLLSSKVLMEQSGSRTCLASFAHTIHGGTSGCQELLTEALVVCSTCLAQSVPPPA